MADREGAARGVTWATLGVACALTGAVMPLDRALLHLMLVAAIVAAGSAPGAWATRWWRAVGCVAAALAVGLLPGPAAWVGAVAPGVASARAGWAWMTLSLDPVATLEALAMVALLGGFGVVFAAALPREPAAIERLEARLAWAGALWMAFGALHALSGTDRLLGLAPVRPIEGRYFAPLVNPNHAGLVAWMSVPFLVARARSSRSFPERLVCGAAVAWAVALPAVSASMGLVVVAAAQLAVAALRAPLRAGVRGALIAGGACLGAAVAVAVSRQQPEWWALSAEPRLRQWEDTWAILRDQPWTGLGGGAYGVGYPPYRTVPAFALFEHAHQDVLEWVAETGLVGVALGLVALAIGPRPLPGAGRAPWAAALAGVAAHALVDFPLRVPAVALLAVALFVGWTTLGADAARAPVARRPAVAAVAQAALAVALLHHAVADRLAARALEADAAAAARLMAWAPWRFEGPVGELLVGVPPGPLRVPDAAADPSLRAAVERAGAVAPERATPLRLLALRLLVAGDRAGAEPWLERALARDPNDWRTWYLEAERRRAEGGGREAAVALAEAMRHWPHEGPATGRALDEGWAWWPVGVWWVDRLADAPAHWSMRLAWLLLREGDAETALLAADQAALLRPSAHRFNPTKAEALVALGARDAAVAYVDAWIAEDPFDVWAQVARARVVARGSDAWWTAVARAGAFDPNLPAARRLLDEASRLGASDAEAAPLVAAIARARAARDRATCEREREVVALSPLTAPWSSRGPWRCDP